MRGVHRASKTRPPPDPRPQLKHHYSYRRWTYSIGRSARPVALAATAPVRPPAGSPRGGARRPPSRHALFFPFARRARGAGPLRSRPLSSSASGGGRRVGVGVSGGSAAGLPATPGQAAVRPTTVKAGNRVILAPSAKNSEGFRVAGRRGGRALLPAGRPRAPARPSLSGSQALGRGSPVGVWFGFGSPAGPAGSRGGAYTAWPSLSRAIMPPRDPIRGHCQAGSLTGAVHLPKSNAGVLRAAQRGQKPRVEQKGKSCFDPDVQ